MKKMRKSLCLMTMLFVITLTSLTTGCVSSRPVSRPDFAVELAPKDYEILGRVTYYGKKHNLFGLFSWGGAAYHKLYEKAKKEFGADDVVNVSLDYQTWAIGGIYNQRTYVMSGIAIKYKK